MAERARAGSTRLGLVVPCLNQRLLLGRLLDSLHSLDVEVVVADGGSTDGSVELLAARRGKGLRYLSQPDHNLYEAVNRGMALLDAEILGYVACDDRILPWTPGLVSAAFAQASNLQLLVGDALEVWGDRAALVIAPGATRLLTHLRLGFFLSQPAVFFRRSLYERLGGFDTRHGLLADHDFFSRALAAGVTTRRLREVLAVQGRGPEQLSVRRAADLTAEAQTIAAARGWSKRHPAGHLAERLRLAALRRLATVALFSGAGGPWSELGRAGAVVRPDLGSLTRFLATSARAEPPLRLTERGRALCGSH